MEEKPPPYSPREGYQTGAPGFTVTSSAPPPPPPPPQQQPPGYHTVIESALPNYGSTVYVHQQTIPPTQVIFVGGCPACRVREYF
ncbi:brain protein I3-like [Centruroides sculpturatus]|uniref:brain protein I3-like n=1 Tax=Centruroides sculpturatus TaxID=218467 RepID=UPI000C6D9BCF|nr:brain protein I3-like [Centruroides sculpturatus]